jgi:predicted nucleic acid-binding protein
LLARYAWKVTMGTFDTAIVASARLAGATRFLSFDMTAKALAYAEGLNVFPPLDTVGKQLLARLRR